MAFIPTINAVKVTILGHLLGQQVVIDITIGTPSAPSVADLNDINDAVDTWLSTELAPTLTGSYVFDEVKAYDLTSATAPVATKPLGYSGTINVNPVVNNAALVTSFLTANRGRSGRGRNYLAGLQDNVGSAISTSSGVAAAVVSAWSALNTYLTPLGFEHVVISNFTGGAARSAGLKQPVISYRTNVDYDSQRRRLAGRGA